MRNIDEIASISARRHARTGVVTASTDSVDFLAPIHPTDSIHLEAFVTWTGNTSMEVFVKAIAEDLLTAKKRIAATAFLTFISLDANGKPSPVPKVAPLTEEERFLYDAGDNRAIVRQTRRELSKILASKLPMNDD